MDNMNMLKRHIVPYEKRLVAFIDLQGFKDNIIKNYPSEAIGAVFGCFRGYSKFITSDYDKISITIISDSIVISSLIEDMTDIIAFFEACFYYSKPKIDKDKFIAVRGGIAYGDLHHKDGIVYGPALVEAYDICEGKRKSSLLRIRMTKETFEFLDKITCFSKAIVFPEDKELTTYFINIWLLFFAISSLSDSKCKDACTLVVDDLYSYYNWCCNNIDSEALVLNIGENTKIY